MTRGPLVLVGAGGHAKAIVETLLAHHLMPEIYIDPRRSDWLEASVPGIRHVEHEGDAGLPEDAEFVLALGAVTPERLLIRRWLGRSLRERGWRARCVVHVAASVSRSATVEDGAIVLAGAVVQPDARLGDFAIVNSRAIVEHDAVVGPGAHVAPGAVVLGAAIVGEDAMVGAGAVVLPAAEVPAGHLVKALSLHPGAGITRSRIGS